MKKTLKALKFPSVFLLMLSTFIACDKDFSVIESDVLGIDNANFYIDSLVLPINAYNKKLDTVQINNLPSNLLGVFNDLEFGKTSASIITQITPASYSEDFDINPIIDSVVINIPYFSTVTGTNAENTDAADYKIDSLYGNIDATFKLKIYQNNYYLRDYDPSDVDFGTQKYYSRTENLVDPTHNYISNGNQEIDFDNHLGELLYENDEFKHSAGYIELWNVTETDTTITYNAPALRILFDSNNTNDADAIAFWQQTIVDKHDDAVLSNANNFKNYFRGLYFKTEAIGDDGSMALMNLFASDANITIYYTKGEETDRTQDEYVLNFSGNILNTYVNAFNVTLEDGDKDNGDETLYLKGLEGSMAVVDLFPTDEDLQDFKDQFRDSEGNQTKFINEAHLVIYEDETKVINTEDAYGDVYHKFDRIYAYDIKNNTTTLDYQIDPFEDNDPIVSKIFSLSQRSTQGKYKIRITEHLNNIIQNDSTNYKLGLVLSNNVNVTATSEVLNSTDDVTAIPSMSTITPRGTILHGSNAIDVDKRLELKVFFTASK
ncbi:DUF4270 domain-containing protein [Algibacter luteus]|uniref:DUF4270 domain-containing protein n=1 Tax=Algibacter luteus TaxID=1178825 RepID=A0A1M6CZP2_9FLAO|nr:DUF4270 domain-containing protein [Algibacter luteus]SHI66477.1 protein of unknown function [Algibacter luteus]